MKRNDFSCKGFHLIELLITFAIVGMLAAISITTYTHYFTREKRLEAASALGNLIIAMEHYHIEHNTYRNTSFKALRFSEYVANNSYQLIIQSSSDDAYLLLAKPLGNQAKNDRTCATLILNSLGQKSISGSGQTNECW